MEQSVMLSVLRELGVLAQAPDAGESPPPSRGLAGPAADHVFFAHTPLWSYEDPRYAYPYFTPGLPPLFESLPGDPGLDAVLGKTRLVVFFGAAATPTLRRCLDAPEVRSLVLETDPARLAALAETVTPARLARSARLLLGRPEDFRPGFAEAVGTGIFASGFPVCYALPGFAPRERLLELAEAVEVLFYRHRLYGLSGQANSRGLPVRPMARGMFYDQQRHFYDNAPAFLRLPDLRPLRRAFAGETAVIIAAGPDLPERVDYLRRARESAVLIAVNNALRPLVAAGVHPHFVVANDNSLSTARSWEGLPPLRDVALVAHCLTDLGRGVFERAYLFGNCEPRIFGRRAGLKLYGSVLTTALSLARHMGCARCVLAGAQLCSRDPWRLAYSRGSVHEAGISAAKPLTNAWPQLVPVRDMAGEARYTTLNFLDVAHWLREDIRASGVPCVHLTRETIVYGPGVGYERDCAITPTGRLPRLLARLAADVTTPRADRSLALAMLAGELRRWEAVAGAAPRVLSASGAPFLDAAGRLFERFERDNTSYLVQRFADFDNERFHALALAADATLESREAGLRDYLEHVGRMAGEFAGLLRERIGEIETMGAAEAPNRPEA